ncbi:hypothetical protein LJC10_05920 [Selenomonadales bacterium OttesenSCG-928-I06]|nr:hypothetical protein [Selenomonadales bacterium OttesenSCG-928-I06]
MTTLEINGKAKTYRELQTYIKQLEEEAEELKAVITAEMAARGVEVLEADVFTIRYTKYQSSRLDTATLKEELPEIASRYTKTVEARRFQVA